MEYIKLNKESGSTTRINFNNGVPYISYRILDDIPWLKNAVSTRLGGVSKDYLASMNLGFNRGDLDENVIRTMKFLLMSLVLILRILLQAIRLTQLMLRLLLKTIVERAYIEIEIIRI